MDHTETEALRSLAQAILEATTGEPLPRRLAALALVAGGLIAATRQPLPSVDVMVAAHRNMTDGFARDAMLNLMVGEVLQ